MAHKKMSTSSCVKVSVLKSSSSLCMTTASLSQIRRERLDAECCRAELAKRMYPFLLRFLLTLIQENTQRVRTLIAEAQLEVGLDYEDPMHDFDDSTLAHGDDNDRYQDNNALDTPLFSQFLQMDAQQRPDEPANTVLLCSGLLGCSPIQPTVAICLECLEVYHQIHRRQSSFSIQAITKVLCALHNVTYSSSFQSQFTIVFDIYLEIFMDGNHSAKRIDGSGLADPRTFHSDYFIPRAAIELFKDDVRNRPGQRSLDQHTGCAENWTTARSVEEAKVSFFQQTGIFIMACRHGLVECIVEMKRSGELAKYGLAAVNRLLDSCGSFQGLGHDIGCTSCKTIAASSIGAKAEQSNLIVAINAFHGYTHNRRCQLANHPLYMNGFGIEDLETCEWIFSSSNSTVILIRHASYFHWVQFIDLHFNQWDQDKYMELSRFLHNNYVQVLRIINEYTPLLDAFKTCTSFSDEDFVQWKAEESEFLTDLLLESLSDAFAVAYVEELEKFRCAEAKYGSVTSVPFLTYTPASFTQSGLNAATRDSSRAIEAELALALRRLQLQMNVVDDFERRHGINERWVSSDPWYIQAHEYCSQRCFTWVIEELEGLVVQRLFELSKANLSGTEVVGYASLGEFALLKHSRHDLLAEPWAIPENWEMAAKFFKVLCSHEELTRLNVEICRLSAWVSFEDKEILSAIDALDATDSTLLAAELQMHYARQHRVNNVHRARLHKISWLSGYTGPPLFLLPEREMLDDEGDGEDEDNGSDELLDEVSRFEDPISLIVLP
ncbi:hypothetical protein F4604DRAFT_1879073 [Suillus subluteus]|nr:hypothetical protein F4604DRAFT_1879073 [Suillus subluteus]